MYFTVVLLIIRLSVSNTSSRIDQIKVLLYLYAAAPLVAVPLEGFTPHWVTPPTGSAYLVSWAIQCPNPDTFHQIESYSSQISTSDLVRGLAQ